MSLVTKQGTHHYHFGAGLGSLGKSVLQAAQQGNIEYATVDPLTGNPIGYIEPKNPIIVYESPLPYHMPIELQKRPFRNPPSFLSSPSRIYVCLLWTSEFRYEILHVPTILHRVGQKLGSGSIGNVDSGVSAARNPVVASGIGVIDFAWIGDDDVFGILYAEDAMEQASFLIPKFDNDGDSFSLAPNLKQIVNVANLTKQATSNALSATKLATSSVTKSATTAANKVGAAATQGVRVGAKAVTKGVIKKSFKMFTTGGKKKMWE
jgi:hypothetical protein